MHPSAIINAERFIVKYLDPNKELTIADIGSMNINGCLRPLFTHNGYTCPYCGNVKSAPPNSNVVCGCWDCYATEPMKFLYCCNGEQFIPLNLQNHQIGPRWKYLGVETKSAIIPYGDLIYKEVGARWNVKVILDDPHKYPWQNNEIDVIVSTSCFEHDDLFWISFQEMVRVIKPGGFIYINTPSGGPYHGYPLDCWRFYKDAYYALSQWCPRAELVEQYIDPNAPTWQDNIGIFRIKE